MLKFSFSALLLAIISLNVSAQTGDFCGTDNQLQKLVEQHPELIQAQKDYEKAIKQKLSTKDDDGEDLIIPVVFHVLHDYGDENITDAQIFDQVNILNRDFGKQNADTTLIIPEFKDIAANTHIRFRLANIAPDGSCTNGITRTPTYLTNDGSNPQIKFEQWPAQRYLNIWVVKKMRSGVAGFAFLPFTVNSDETTGLDGIVILNNYIGSIGTSSSNTSRSLTHECGHYLNLQHPWGSTNDPGVSCGDDEVEDTPITQGWNYCPSIDQADRCNAGIIENFQNYMDYSYCSLMYTEGQAARMRATLHLDIAYRNLLVSPENNVITGVANENPNVCTPKVDFYSTYNFSCVGEPLQFHTQITNGTAESLSWSFPGANTESSNSANPTVTYNTPGWKTVTLTAGNATGSGTKTKEFAVYIYDANSISETQFQESFTTANALDNRWIIANANENDFVEGVNWEWSPVGCLDEGSLKLNLFDRSTPELYSFISPKFNLEGKEGQFVSFKYAFATQGNPTDIHVKLKVYSTKDCGYSSPLRFSIENPAEILTAGNYSDIDFAPTNIGMWKTAVFPITASQAVDGIQYIFEITSDFGENNFYIDNLNIGSALVSTNDEEVVNKLSLFPNPAQGNSQLDLTLIRPSSMAISIYDIAGKMVKSLPVSNFPAGTSTVNIETNDLTNGAYLIRLEGAEINKALKLLVAH